jgi:putative endonuclease
MMIRCAKQDSLRSFSEGGQVYYVYLIESLAAQGERYVGMTTDLKARL